MQIRNCFIRPREKSFAICGKCGKRIYRDTYHYKLHAMECQFSPQDMTELLNEDEPGCYMLQAKEDGLHFMILAPAAIVDPKVKTRYTGGKWSCVFHSVFPKNDKRIRQLSQGYKDTLSWIKTIRLKNLPSLHTASDITVIRRAFPGLPGIFSLEMFYSIFTGRGIRSMDEEKVTLLKEFLHSPNERYRVASDSRYTRNHDYYRKVAYLSSLIISDVRLYDYADEMFFLIQVKHTAASTTEDRSSFRMLLGKDLLLCDEKVGLEDLITNCMTAAYQKAALVAFDQRYPEYHLSKYMEKGGKNLFPALIGPTYHKVYELLCGACLPIIADGLNFESIYFHRNPDEYRNLKDLLYLPSKILKKLTYWPLSDSQLKGLGQVLKTHPEYLNVDKINLNLILFFYENNIGYENFVRTEHTRNGSRQYYPDIRHIDNFSSRDILRMVRYLSNDKLEYSMYRDYLNMTDRLGERPDGLTPGQLGAAHYRALGKFNLKNNELEAVSFTEFTTSASYLGMTTISNPPSDEELRDYSDPYMIMAPLTPLDLIKESEKMHNCVRTYINRVSKQYTRIFFLRKAKDPFKPFVTIEVRNNNLIQVKAFANSIAGPDVQRYVIAWAKEHSIDYRFCRDITIAA